MDLHDVDCESRHLRFADPESKEAGKPVVVVYRDFKPDNIIVRDNGALVLIDLGLARRMKTGGVSGSHPQAGTAEYLSPEQILGQPLTEKVDVYTFGIVLGEMFPVSRGACPM